MFNLFRNCQNVFQRVLSILHCPSSVRVILPWPRSDPRDIVFKTRGKVFEMQKEVTAKDGSGSVREGDHILRGEEREQAEGICLTELWMNK